MKILLIDNDSSFYDAFFEFTGWDKIEPDKIQGKLDNNLAIASLHEEFDVIMVDINWLKDHEHPLLLHLHKKDKPFILVGRISERGKSIEGFKWTIEHGGSDYFPEEIFSPKGAQNIILRILELFDPATRIIGPPDRARQTLTDLLRQPTICFSHWPYFNQPAENVFEPEVLEILESVTSKELPDIVMSAICKAFYDGYPKVKKQHLRERLKVNASIDADRKKELEQEAFARNRFSEIERMLADKRSLFEIERMYPKIRLELRELRSKNPHIDIRSDYRHIFKAFPFAIGVFYHNEKKSIAIEFKERYLPILKHRFNFSNIYDYNLPGIEEESILKSAKDMDVFLLFLCRDSIHSKFIGMKVTKKALKRQLENHPVIFLILTEDCNWEVAFEKEGRKKFTILPGASSPLSSLPLEEAFRQMNDEIFKVLSSIWPL